MFIVVNYGNILVTSRFISSSILAAVGRCKLPFLGHAVNEISYSFRWQLFHDYKCHRLGHTYECLDPWVSSSVPVENFQKVIFCIPAMYVSCHNTANTATQSHCIITHYNLPKPCAPTIARCSMSFNSVGSVTPRGSHIVRPQVLADGSRRLPSSKS